MHASRLAAQSEVATTLQWNMEDILGTVNLVIHASVYVLDLTTCTTYISQRTITEWNVIIMYTFDSVHFIRSVVCSTWCINDPM